MKLKITFFMFCLIYFNYSAQNIEILDQNSLKQLSGVEVFEENSATKLVTDYQGKLDISTLSKTVNIIIRKDMYFDQKLTFDELTKLSFKVYLIENINSFDEVVVSASRFEEKRKDVVQKIQVIRNSDLQNINQTSTADVMSNSGNVFVQKSQQGGGSPIIRGFETNKVLMVVDGVRMNNAIYRGGHLQNIITLDNSIMEKVEIVYGSGSVVYGSDALGGVMHFYTKNPMLSENEKLRVQASAYSRYTSANSGYAEHADISVGGKKFASLTSFTYSNYGDLRQGAQRNPFYGNFGSRPWYVKSDNGIDSTYKNTDTNLQVGSGYAQYDLLQKFLYKQSEKVTHIVNLQYSNSSDISRYDRLTQLSGGKPKYADWHYGPQKRAFASYTIQLNNSNKFYNHGRIIFGYQNIEESRIDRKYKKVFENHRIEKLDIITFNADFDKKTGKHELRYGVDGFYNKVNSTAFTKNIQMDTTGVRSE
jgi:hemoglobin/transferrin/lactoferrin receptor protein